MPTLFKLILGLGYIAFLANHHAAVAQQPDRSETYTGVVEGYYGTPWTAGQRRDLVEFMGEFGLKHYVYAPKDDPLHRSRWSELYPESTVTTFRQLLDHGSENKVTIWFAISPGLSIRYSSEEDFKRLTDKMEQLIRAGFRNVALFLDDVPEQLPHAEDREVYPNIAYAHADLIQRLHTFLNDREVALWVCPTVYSDSFGDQSYLEILGPLMPAEVPLFWTGPDVASPNISAADISRWTQRTGTKPLIWDNYPVNDYEVWRPFLGPYPSRDAGGVAMAQGFIANPGPSIYTSMVGLATLADLIGDPAGYQPSLAHERALRRLFGDDVYSLLEPLMSFYGAYGWEDHVLSGLYKPGIPVNVAVLDSVLVAMEQHLAALGPYVEGRPRLAGLLGELAHYLDASKAKYEAMRGDPMYAVVNGSLLFRQELDAYKAAEVRRPLSVNSEEWRHVERHPLVREGVADSSHLEIYHVQYATTLDTLYTRIHFKVGTDLIVAQQTLFNGNLATLAVASNPAMEALHPSADDLFVVTTPGSPFEELSRFTLELGGFASRGISDINLRQISHFFHQYAIIPEAGERHLFDGVRMEGTSDHSGFFLMAAIPRYGHDEMRLNWSLNINTTLDDTVSPTPRTGIVNWMASRRPYLGNPGTWVRIRLTN